LLVFTAFSDYPPRQKAASFWIDRALPKLWGRAAVKRGEHRAQTQQVAGFSGLILHQIKEIQNAVRSQCRF